VQAPLHEGGTELVWSRSRSFVSFMVNNIAAAAAEACNFLLICASFALNGRSAIHRGHPSKEGVLSQIGEKG